MKSNVTNIQHNANVPTTNGSRPLALTEDNLLGWLIYRPDTDEFLYSHRAGIGYTNTAYVKQPAFAYCFANEQLAFRYSTFIDMPTHIVRLHDFGDQLVVRF